ncbi:MAG: response regulator [Candidatus Kerfeldbacteria bacterium CG08_land_8_20_14_0_20_40_16]|uniref:Response regulator n=1 Tax=Candidatus Kerfeldbacteria bacterium CG08_land_8_20_14_0_20_40_16 TaxID=2014244 RepID=A0A2H0YW49_9BACT|nr:MAG: response regulator [Candidatus Kerfeldbacteria bacterium CG08_land_8_20_14_0_20_40_16]
MDKQKVLLVEDEPSLTAMYQAVFRETPYELLATKDAKSGSELAEKELPKLILLDIIIPREDGKVVEFNKRVGFELLAKLKKNPKTKNIPVIVLTNLDSPEDRAKAKKLGSEEYLIKANFLPKEVVDQVSKILKKK